MSSNSRVGNSDKPWCLEQLENIWLKGQAASKKMNYRAKNQKKKKAQGTRQLENKKGRKSPYTIVEWSSGYIF